MNEEEAPSAREIEMKLAALHREWNREKERFLTPGADGENQEPKSPSIAFAVAIMVGSVLVMAILAASPLPSATAYIPLIPFAIATFRLLVFSNKSEAYERAKTAYESQRHQLLSRLTELSKQDSR